MESGLRWPGRKADKHMLGKGFGEEDTWGGGQAAKGLSSGKLSFFLGGSWLETGHFLPGSNLKLRPFRADLSKCFTWNVVRFRLGSQNVSRGTDDRRFGH